MEYEDITQTEGGDNEVTISSLEGSLEPIESQAVQFLGEQAVDRDIIIVMSWCKSGEFPERRFNRQKSWCYFGWLGRIYL